MTKLDLSVAFGNYDRTRPLLDGTVQIDGVNPVFMALPPEEIFFRAFRHAEFDICELSLSSFTQRTAQGGNPYVGVPVFLSRTFRHTSIYVRTDRIKSPADLRGKKIGCVEYQMTANVWARAFLEDDFGINPSDIHWISGGVEHPGQPEKIAINLPSGVRLDLAPEGRSLSQMLADGEIDAYMGPRIPSCVERGVPNVAWLFPDPMAAAKDYFKRTGIFPIMHLVGVRRAIVDRHPWLPTVVLKAFEQSKSIAFELLSDTSSTKVMMPFVEEQLKAIRGLMGLDYWPYGVEPNRKVLATFLDHHHRQGLSPRLVAVDDLFHPATREPYKI